MSLISLLGSHLKSDEVIDLLEEHDAQVFYDFDRLHEGTPDKYYVVLNDQGFELGFDEAQILTTIWCHIVGDESTEPVDTQLIGVPLYASVSAVQSEAQQADLACELPTVPEMQGKWAKIVSDHFSVHYSFANGNLDRVTLQLRKPDER